ncbi:MAG: 4Fe-4S binding protein [Chloroflexi bacterium]|nr:4Fe-4S binding protein [Chloroflexota bacterium]
MENIDLSVEVAGVKFRNPVLVAASDLTCDTKAIRNCVEGGAGGIVMKGLSVQQYSRTRPLPYYFSLERFGRGYQTGNWFSPEGYNYYPPDEWLKRFGPESVKICHDNGVPFVGQISIQVGDDMTALLDIAKRLEELGADMLQASQFLCPNDPNIPKSYCEARADNVRALKEAVSIPIFDKMNSAWPNIFLDCVAASERAGASAITVWTGSTGIFVDVDKEEFYGIPIINAYMHGRAWVPDTMARVVEAKQTVSVPLSASSGVWDWSDVVSYLLVGASTVQVCTAAYFKGRNVFGEIVKGVEKWMTKRGYHSISEFCGKLLPRVRSLEELCPEVYPLPSPVTPVIDYELCNFCGKCVQGCVYGSLERIDREQGKIIQHKELCWGCGMCVSRCPVYAIKSVDEKGNVRWDGRGEAKFWL